MKVHRVIDDADYAILDETWLDSVPDGVATPSEVTS